MSKCTSHIIIEMIKALILEGRIDDTFWLEIILAMTYIKNLQPIRALEGSITPVKMQDKDLLNKDLPNLHHFRILRSSVYVFLHKKERILKSAKWDIRALKGGLIGFDRHTICRVHIDSQYKVIRVKNL